MGCPERVGRLAEPALLPCPFCQRTPRPRPWGPVVIATPVLEALALDSGGGWRVTCYGCRVQTWNGLTRDEAMAAWNTRVPPTVAQAQAIQAHLASHDREAQP